jgi:hypothetical protein
MYIHEFDLNHRKTASASIADKISLMLFVWVKNVYIQQLHAMSEMKNKRKWAYMIIICKTNKFKDAMIIMLIYQ